MNEASRYALISAFDESRSAFLASIDQAIAEVRPTMLRTPEYYGASVVACANSFASRELVRDQLEAISPSLLDEVADEDLNDAHLVTVAYLFSLMLHEAIRNNNELPTIPEMKEEETDA